MRLPCRRLVRTQGGFTLLELLVVVAIIGVLAAFALPRLWEAINSAKGARGVADMKMITAALDRYYVDHNVYPIGAHADEIMNMLRAGYLRRSTTFRNGFARGYLYLTSDSGSGYVLIDVKNEKRDDDPATLEHEIIIRCSDGISYHDRTFVIEAGDTAGLTLPTDPSGYWRVGDEQIKNCRPREGGWDVQIETN
jgi:prepilin-type N-terminal cleavage/methylation domain-containing protein